MLELAASKVADFTAFDHSGVGLSWLLYDYVYHGTAFNRYVDSPFYAALLGLVFVYFFPLLNLSTSGRAGKARLSFPKHSYATGWDLSTDRPTCSRLDAAISQSLCFALALYVAYPLSYDAEMHRNITVLVLFLTAAKGLAMFTQCGEGTRPFAVAVLCTLQVFAAFVVISIELEVDGSPALNSSLKYVLSKVKECALEGYVPCLALGLVALTTSAHDLETRTTKLEAPIEPKVPTKPEILIKPEAPTKPQAPPARNHAYTCVYHMHMP